MKNLLLFSFFISIIFSETLDGKPVFNVSYDDLPRALKPKFSAEEVGDVFKTLKVIDLVCRKHKITYWLDGGCLLGAIRHGGFIPWDVDADIEIFADDCIRFADLTGEFAKYGLVLARRRVPEGYLRLGFVKPVHTDVFLTTWMPRKGFYGLHRYYSSFPNNYYYEDELFPLKRIKFGPIEINAPNKPMAYLLRQYGPHAMTTVPKKTRWQGKYQPVIYKLDRFVPAEYTIREEDKYIFELESLD